MKRFTFIMILFAMTLGLSGCILEETSFLYTNRTSIDNFEIVVNNTANCCFVGPYTCIKYDKNYEITIPDYYNEYPITRIGGYYGKGLPNPFHVNVSEQFMNAPEGSRYDVICYIDGNDFNIADPYTVQELTFILNIGENIKTIENIDNPYYPHINDDGSITLYHPVFYINCSTDNKHFYSENGKLYDKDTNELITDFDYPTDITA